MAMTFGGNSTPSDVARTSTNNIFTTNQVVLGSLSSTGIVAASSIKIDQGALEAGTSLTTSLSNLVITINNQTFRVPLL